MSRTDDFPVFATLAHHFLEHIDPLPDPYTHFSHARLVTCWKILPLAHHENRFDTSGINRKVVVLRSLTLHWGTFGDVGGLSEEVDEKIIQGAFIPFGEILDIQIPLDYETGE